MFILRSTAGATVATSCEKRNPPHPLPSGKPAPIVKTTYPVSTVPSALKPDLHASRDITGEMMPSPHLLVTSDLNPFGNSEGVSEELTMTVLTISHTKEPGLLV